MDTLSDLCESCFRLFDLMASQMFWLHWQLYGVPPSILAMHHKHLNRSNSVSIHSIGAQGIIRGTHSPHQIEI